VTSSSATTAMTEGRRADSARRRQRVIKALNEAINNAGDVSVSGIAQRAGVDRTFLYRHRDLLEQLHAANTNPPASQDGGPSVTRASLQADLANANDRARRLTSHVQQLEKRLSEALGEQAWRESGLGAPIDIDQLQQQITTLEQTVIDLRLQLEERDQDLNAARNANRELITRLNT
jgi:Family of unknown function (DUF6262)